jgi:hypothetical protein
VANIQPAFSAIITVALRLTQSLPAPTDDRNLCEFSIVSYGDGGIRFGSPGPPRLRVYDSERFVVHEDNRYVEGLLTPGEISRLRT